MERQRYIEFLIRELKFFNENKKQDFHEDIPKPIIELLVFEEIKQLPTYENIDKKFFDTELTFENKIQELEKLKVINTTLPANIEELRDFVQKHQETISETVQREPDYDWISRLRQITQIEAEKEPVINDFIKFKNEIQTTQIDIQIPAVLISKIIFFSPRPIEIKKTKDYVQEYVKSIDPENPSLPEISTENIATNFVEAIDTTTSWERLILPTAAIIAIPKIAKDDKKAATAMTLYYQYGIEEKDIKPTEIKKNQASVDVVTKYLRTYQSVHPFIAKNIIERKADLSFSQKTQIINILNNYAPQDWYENVAAVRPVTGFRGYFLRAGQQVFGGPAANFVEGSIRKGVQNLAGKAAGAVIKKVAAKALGLAIPGIGTIATELISRALPLIKKWGLPILGALAGFAVGGPLLAVGGIGAGLFATGAITGGSVSAGISTVAGAFATLGGAFASAIIMPLIIAVIAIPITVALILFIINAGAYVVPPGSAVTGGNLPPGGGVGASFSCTGGKISGNYTTGCTGISENATAIASSLGAGFWGFYNHTCLFPDRWDQKKFDQSNGNPCISAQGQPQSPTGCGGIYGEKTHEIDMFWCTWLIIEAYKQAGINIPPETGVPGMEKWFKSQSRFADANTNMSNLPNGTAVFFDYAGTGTHVAMITKKGEDYATITESNAASKTETFKATNGILKSNLGDYQISGYGLPPAQCK